MRGPKNATTHIQNTAPGPPNAMAVATPTILPVPTRPESAMQNASNDDIPSLPRFPPKSERSISPKRLTCTSLVRTEKYSPAPISSTTNPGFHTMSFNQDTAFSILVYLYNDNRPKGPMFKNRRLRRPLPKGHPPSYIAEGGIGF